VSVDNYQPVLLSLQAEAWAGSFGALLVVCLYVMHVTDPA